MIAARHTRALEPSGNVPAIRFHSTILGKAAQVMHDLLAQPQAMPHVVLKRHALPVSFHSFDLNLLWLWSTPVKDFLNVIGSYDRLRVIAVTGRTEVYPLVLKALLRQPLLSALKKLRTAFKSPPDPAQIDHVSRILLRDLCPSKCGLEADLVTLQKTPIPCRLDLWLEELGWLELTQIAQGRDRAITGLFRNLSSLTTGQIQREMRRIAA